LRLKYLLLYIYKMNNISLKLDSYLNKIKEQTKRELLIEYVDDFEVPGMQAAFRIHPTHINIIIKNNSLKEGPEFENNLAHEATHGLLNYGKKYFSPNPILGLTKNELNLFGLITTMIDDIVVNYHLSIEGFKPFSEVYIGMVKREIDFYNKNLDIYSSFPDPVFKSKFKIFRYVLAWGFVKYFDISSHNKILLKNFLKTFKRTFPLEFKEAEYITKKIVKHDIFTQTGHEFVIRFILKLWKLDSKIQN
jgi:hypothetical protein